MGGARGKHPGDEASGMRVARGKHPGDEASRLKGARWIDRTFLGRLVFGPSPIMVLGLAGCLMELGMGPWYPQYVYEKKNLKSYKINFLGNQ